VNRIVVEAFHKGAISSVTVITYAMASWSPELAHHIACWAKLDST